MAEPLEWEPRMGVLVAYSQRSGAVSTIYAAEGKVLLSWLTRDEGGLVPCHHICDAQLHARHCEARFALKAIRATGQGRSSHEQATPG